MNKIEKLHLDAIQKDKGVRKQLCVNDFGTSDLEKTVASKSAEITQQIAIEFAEWCESNAAREKSGMWMMYLNPTILITKEQLFQEFLKTKHGRLYLSKQEAEVLISKIQEMIKYLEL